MVVTVVSDIVSIVFAGLIEALAELEVSISAVLDESTVVDVEPDVGILDAGSLDT